MYQFISLLLVCLFSFPAFVAAKEPANLASVKQELKQYHDNGQYHKDIAAVIGQAMDYLKSRLAKGDFHGKPAIILDIDETALSNYPGMLKLDFGGTLDDVLKEEDKGLDKAILPTLNLYRFAKANHVAVFFITGRYEFERKATADNLKKAGYKNWDGLILRSGEHEKTPAAVYKPAMRKQIAAKGYNIILNIGDQKSDLDGGLADKTFKLPDPYYFIP
jgi:acid phosphatase